MPTKERRERAKKRAQEGSVTFKVPVESPPETPPSAQEQEADAEIQAAHDTTPGRAEARIHRIDETTGKKLYLGPVSPSLISHRWLMQTLGGGTYLVVYFKPSGEDKRLAFAGQEQFDIDPSIPRKTPPWAMTASDTPLTGPVSTPSTSHSSVVDSQLVSLFTMQQQSFRESIESARKDREMQNMMLQAWLERMANGSKPSTDWVELAKIFGPGVLKAMGDRRDPLEIARELTETITKATTRAPEPPSALTDALALMDRLDARFRRNNPAAAVTGEADDSLVGFLKTAFPEVLATFRETLAARRQAAAMTAGRAPGGANGNGAAPDPSATARVISGPTMTAASPPTITPPPTASVPLATPDQTTTPPTGPSADPMMPSVAWAPFVKQYIPALIQWADDNREPEIYAVVLLDAIDKEGRYDVAAPLLADPGFTAEFLKAFPEARATPKRAEWFTDLFAAVREELKPDDAQERGEEETG